MFNLAFQYYFVIALKVFIITMQASHRGVEKRLLTNVVSALYMYTFNMQLVAAVHSAY